MTVPVLETERLLLRAHRAEDFPACAAMWADPVVTRFIGGVPSTGQQAWGRMLNYAGLWALLGFGYWAVEEKKTGGFVGELGFADFKRDISPPIEGPELGWALVPAVHGRGIATEALRAVVAWGDVRFQGGRTSCIIGPGNLASIRVAEKLGYREARRTAYKGEPTIVFER
jgi:RimJ/RimL family protein N-acetyltransferase